MIGIVIVSHGNLAQEFHHTLNHIIGPQQAIATVNIGPNDDMEIRRQDILNAIHTIDQGEGVIILTDMFGGTPSNLAISTMGRESKYGDSHVEVIAGISLPLLVKLAKVRTKNTPLKQAVAQARDAGHKYMVIASEFLNKEQNTGFVMLPKD